ETLSKGSSARSVERDLANGVTRYRISEDGGLNRHPGNGLSTRDAHEEIWSITQGDPLSMTAEIRWTCEARREGWRTRTHIVSTMSCTETEWVISERVEAFHEDKSVFARERASRIPRDHM
ncbi:MAG TPA: peptidase, partial [Mesorhizobium sp.]